MIPTTYAVTNDHVLWAKLRGISLVEAKYIATEKLFLPKAYSKSAERKSFVLLFKIAL